jgi:hypothetical protein
MQKTKTPLLGDRSRGGAVATPLSIRWPPWNSGSRVAAILPLGGSLTLKLPKGFRLQFA